jgi:hypothetical protein
MNKLIFVVMSILATSSFACPDLTGQFLCKDFNTGDDQNVTIAQEIRGEIVTTNIQIEVKGDLSERDYIADGKPKTIESSAFTEYTETSICEEGKLLVSMSGIAKETGDKLEAIVTVLIDRDNSLYNSYIGTLGERKINFEEVCKRK